MAWLAIRLTPEMTRPRFYNLMAAFASPDDVLGAPAAAIARVRGFDQALAQAVLAMPGTAPVQRHADQLAALGVHIVTRDDPDYPANLHQSSLAPPMLFVKGTLAPSDRYSVAMVGSRHATQYGRAVAAQLAEGLARCGITVISGFARGVDGEAHNAALKAGGRTIAVLGNGLDICYPSEHRGLVDKVAAQGALVSEYPLGTSPDRFNFPERNHVIAALALGTIVAEAAEKSGSLITARLAVEENRFIFAVPGDITRNNSRGANALIQQGARLVQRHQDVLFEMKEVLRGYLSEEQLSEEPPAAAPTPKPTRVAAPAPKSESPAASASKSESPTAPPPALAAATSSAPVANLSADEQFIIDQLRHEAQVFDELANRAWLQGIDTPRLSSLLMKLELRKIIRQLPGRYYVMFT